MVSALVALRRPEIINSLESQKVSDWSMRVRISEYFLNKILGQF